MAWATPSNKATTDLVTAAHWNQDVVANPNALAEGAIIVPLDGGGYVLPTGIVARVLIPKPLTITQVTLLLDQTGDIVVDIWKDTYANYPPDDSDSITASAVPTISSGLKYQDGTLTGWTTSIAAGDIIFFNIDSIATATYCTVILKTAQA